jgi:DNA-binding CsgD family transcriptional regulator
MTSEEAATALFAAGDATGAAVQLDLAQQEYEAVGAVAWSDRIAAARRRLGGGRGGGVARRRPAVGWESLTRSELAVAELVSQGLTNREVAGRLYVSPHTVNTHLRHIFQKLEVGNRAQLARMVAEHHASE